MELQNRITYEIDQLRLLADRFEDMQYFSQAQILRDRIAFLEAEFKKKDTSPVQVGVSNGTNGYHPVTDQVAYGDVAGQANVISKDIQSEYVNNATPEEDKVLVA